MREHDLKQLIKNQDILDEKINDFLAQGILKKQAGNKEEIEGHLEKAEHDLRFVAKNVEIFQDWAISGCYFACYHAALSLILTKGYFSKNHLATLCVLIKEFYKKELDDEDLDTLSRMLDYEDVQFYVESKNKRENATYSTNILFDRKEVSKLRIKAALFVSKVKRIVSG